MVRWIPATWLIDEEQLRLLEVIERNTVMCCLSLEAMDYLCSRMVEVTN